LGLAFEEEQVAVPEPQKETVTYQRKKQHAGRKPLPDHLPTEDIVIEPEMDTTDLVKIGEEITEELDYTPASLIKRRFIRPKYALPKGEGVLIAAMPERVLPKSIAGPGLLTQLVVQKFCDHLPFYRQQQIFKRDFEVTIPKSSMNDWFAAVCKLLHPLYESLRHQLKTSNYLMADESPIKVQDKDKVGKTHQGYQWVYYDPLGKTVLFEYQKGRGSNGPKRMLENFEGYLQTDGYKVYDKFGQNPEITLVGCMAHVRRYFERAKDNDPDSANYVLEQIRQLYALERQMKQEQLLPEQIQQQRQQMAQPILEQLGNWIDQKRKTCLHKSAIAKACHYAQQRWDKLLVYLEDGNLHIDNNLIENTIRPLALGRKNYLFAGSHSAAQNIAMIYSFFATCKVNDINPAEWLKDVLNKINQHPINQIELLLPFRWKNNQS